MTKDDLAGGIGPQARSDRPKFKRRMRFHQSWYRASVLGVDYGETLKDGKRRPYGNLLAERAAKDGKNFLTPKIHDVVKKRVEERGNTSVGDPSRLCRNMLSSQPMCFNLFGELACDHELASKLVRASWGRKLATLWGSDQIAVTVTDVRFEWAPAQREKFLKDRTAFDAFIEYRTEAGENGFIAVETKLTEPFSQKEYNLCDKNYSKWMTPKSPWGDDANCAKLKAAKYNQLTRNHLLAWALLDRKKYAHGSVAVVHHPKDKHCRETVEGYRNSVPHETRLPVWRINLGGLIDSWQGVSRAAWIRKFEERYLALDKSNSAWETLEARQV
ncbi:MAG: hypothetical protein OXU42_11375 [Deltaproteobacteria bacterium]|nr:hypothetical protein [Deltaproteobacteria bacterium]